ncbi:hypothetical protein [Microbacterium sp. CH1]|uniref:hypothetical protein n=1 Tax=Microbacterium sp. CH1 TaxID=1770208 RepID=UPI000786CBE6|nr:hypothetical protein [Microbacterium sp. CH1]KYJ98029.1 hypothetical protein AUV07_12075 [Microbacterium sp. CH1]
MTHDNEAIYELYEQLAQKTAQMRAATESLGPDPVEDATGQVSVLVDDTSIDISIGSFWRASVRPEALSGVIMETVNNAFIARLTAWGESFTQDAAAVPSSPVPSPLPSAHEISELVAAADGDTFHRNVNRFVDTFSSQLSATLAALTERANQVHHGKDAHNHATVTLDSSGTLIGLELDVSWLHTADGGAVTDTIRAAMADARQSVAAATPSAPFEGTPLSEYAEGMADPVELIRMLTRGG